ncbi:MAG: DUF1572 domain-containing protein [Ferruginibacter sp.]
MENNYIDSVKKQFSYYKMLGEKAMAQLPEEKLYWHYNGESNSIAVIVKHLWGNMLSRWTDFLATDGEKEWRNRNAEFYNDLQTREDLLAKWEQGWKCLFDAIDPLNSDDLGKEIFIRNMGHSVMEAINRQLAHYSYHVGQIVYIAKMACDHNWNSLSIPRGNSNEYNKVKFALPQHTEHFTSGFLKDKEE